MSPSHVSLNSRDHPVQAYQESSTGTFPQFYKSSITGTFPQFYKSSILFKNPSSLLRDSVIYTRDIGPGNSSNGGSNDDNSNDDDSNDDTNSADDNSPPPFDWQTGESGGTLTIDDDP